MNAFDAAATAGREGELRRELETLFASCNESGDLRTSHIPANLLRVTVSVP